jgi:hypothetical protein
MVDHPWLGIAFAMIATTVIAVAIVALAMIATAMITVIMIAVTVIAVTVIAVVAVQHESVCTFRIGIGADNIAAIIDPIRSRG